MSWSRNYSPQNTRRLRALIRSRRIVVDVENGAVFWPNGKPVHARENFWGYTRFQVRVKRKDGRRVTNWFFVHKAVMVAQGSALKKNHEINHKDGIRSNNRAENLELIHYKENMALVHSGSNVDPAF
jgi:hypothetical protein